MEIMNPCTFQEGLELAKSRGERDVVLRMHDEVRLAQHLDDHESLLESERQALDRAVADWRIAEAVVSPARDEELFLLAWLRRKNFDYAAGVLPAEQLEMLDGALLSWRQAAEEVCLSF